MDTSSTPGETRRGFRVSPAKMMVMSAPASSPTSGPISGGAPRTSRSGEPRPIAWAEQARIIFMKDVAIELRTGEVLSTSAFFAVVCVVMSSISFYEDPRNASQVGAGAIWLSTAFASVLSLSRTWQRERQDRAFDAMIVSPLSHSAIFMGKALGMLAFLLAVEALVVPVAVVLFNIDFGRHALGLGGIALAATPGIAAAGALFGVMTVRTRARDLVLAIVLFPLLSPTLLAAVAATRDLLDGQPFAVLAGWFKVMFIFDVAFVAGGLALFGPVADGG
jgi:heme exporter protein B